MQEIQVEEINGILTVRLPRDFPLAKSDRIHQVFEPLVARNMPMALDVGLMEYIDSAGLSTLLWLNRRTPSKLKLINLSEKIKHVIGLTEVAQFFEFDEPQA